MTPAQKLRTIADSMGLDGYAESIREIANDLEQAPAPASTQDEPFGYFRADAMGWTDCAADDEGAIALYERPAAPAVPQGEPVVGYRVSHPSEPDLGTWLVEEAPNDPTDLLVEPLVLAAQAPAPAVPQGVIYEKADSLYKRGYTDSQNGKDYDPRGCDEWQEVVDCLDATPAALREKGALR